MGQLWRKYGVFARNKNGHCWSTAHDRLKGKYVVPTIGFPIRVCQLCNSTREVSCTGANRSPSLMGIAIASHIS